MFCESVEKGDNDQSDAYEGIKLDLSIRVYSLGYNSEVFLFTLKYYIIVVLTKHVIISVQLYNSLCHLRIMGYDSCSAIITHIL